MYRTLARAVCIAVLAGMLAVPAMAAQPERRIVEQLDVYSGPHWNPCTDEMVMVHVTGELTIHAVPSVEAFFAGDFTHATFEIVAESSHDGGYSEPRRHFFIEVRNGDSGASGLPGEPRVHQVLANHMFSSNDGGKYSVHTMLHMTVVGSEVKTSIGFENARCLQYPTS